MTWDVTLPMPAPTTILPESNMNLSEANARTRLPAMKMRLAIIMTNFRPIRSFRIPPIRAKTAAPPGGEESHSIH